MTNFAKGRMSPFVLAVSSAAIYSARLSVVITTQSWPPEANITFIRTQRRAQRACKDSANFSPGVAISVFACASNLVFDDVPILVFNDARLLVFIAKKQNVIILTIA